MNARDGRDEINQMTPDISGAIADNDSNAHMSAPVSLNCAIQSSL
jgi:hypothetical protein